MEEHENLDERKLEEFKRELIEAYGDDAILDVIVGLPFNASHEGRQLNKTETAAVMVLSAMYYEVEAQMRHLGSICEEPITDPAKMNKDEKQRLSDYIAFDCGDEKIAARADLVRLHKPIPDEVLDLPDEEAEAYYRSDRGLFAPLTKITVEEAIDYVDYWEQERQGVEAMQTFASHWKGTREIAEIVGDEPPRTVGAYIAYLSKLEQGEEE